MLKREGTKIKIIGGKDYYDVGLSMGIDPMIILLRGKSKSIPVSKVGGTLLAIRPSTRIVYTKRDGVWCPNGESIIAVAVVLCDKVYRGVLVPDGWKAGKGTKFEGIWSADKLRAWAEKKKTKVEMRGPWHSRGKLKFEDYFAPSPVSDAMRRYMVMNKISILTEKEESGVGDDDRAFHVNPSDLRSFGFAKAVDPYMAFQELSMWIGGVLGGTSPEIVAIKDDKVLIEGHGFDNRFSFRGPRLA